MVSLTTARRSRPIRELWSARSELGINLMRLGQEEKPRKQLEMCYEQRLPKRSDRQQPSPARQLQEFRHLSRIDGTILKLHKKEADLLRPYFEERDEANIADYEKKYKMKLPGPVQVEVYPDHEDFAVRTHGHAGPRRAGRYIRRSHRHGQPVGPPARRVSLGQHAVA